jgi:putative lipoic acid-binding regulatory protein
MKNTTPKTKTKTKATQPTSVDKYSNISVVEILAETQEQIDNHAEVINDHSETINNHAEVLEQARENADILDAKVTLVFWFCGITTAIATALAITALVCK